MVYCWQEILAGLLFGEFTISAQNWYNLADQSRVDAFEHTQYYGNTEFNLAVLSCIHQSTKLINLHQ